MASYEDATEMGAFLELVDQKPENPSLAMKCHQWDSIQGPFGSEANALSIRPRGRIPRYRSRIFAFLNFQIFSKSQYSIVFELSPARQPLVTH